MPRLGRLPLLNRIPAILHIKASSNPQYCDFTTDLSVCWQSEPAHSQAHFVVLPLA